MAVRLSALRAGRPLPPTKIPGTHFCQKRSRLQGHRAAGRIKSIEKSSDLIGSRTRDLPACIVVPRMEKWQIYLAYCLLQKNALYYDTSNVGLLRERFIKILKSWIKFVAVTIRQYSVKCEAGSEGEYTLMVFQNKLPGEYLGLGGMKYQRDKGNYKVRSVKICALHLTSFVYKKNEFNMTSRLRDEDQNTCKIQGSPSPVGPTHRHKSRVSENGLVSGRLLRQWMLRFCKGREFRNEMGNYEPFKEYPRIMDLAEYFIIIIIYLNCKWVSFTRWQ
jgi:hypothetical protein